MDLHDIREFIIDFSSYIISIVFVFLFVVYVFSLQIVFGSSMSPTFESNDIVILNKISYKFFDINRGDLVSVEFENANILTKRVIGLPGEYIKIKDNKLYITKDKETKEQDEPYVLEDTNDFELKDINYEVIPDDLYLVLGDNRNNSTDGRDLGLIHKKFISGKIDFRIWPINKFGIVK